MTAPLLAFGQMIGIGKLVATILIWDKLEQLDVRGLSFDLFNMSFSLLFVHVWECTYSSISVRTDTTI